jgi:hypothetical protein
MERVLVSFDFASGSTHELVLSPTQTNQYNGGALGVRIAPDGKRAFLTGVDGKLRSVRLPDLGDDKILAGVAVETSNANSYMPATEAPIALDSTGRYLAFLNQDLDLVVRDLKTAKDRVIPMEGFGSESSVAMAMEFDAEAGRLAIIADHGFRLLQCKGNATAAPAVGGTVTIEGPDDVGADEGVDFTIEADGFDYPYGTTVELDGEFHSFAQDVFHWAPAASSSAAGEHTLRITVTDGRRERAIERTVTVH